MNTITEMKNEIVNLYGLENENTIYFFNVCEHFPYGKKLIRGVYIRLLKKYEKMIEED